MSIDIKKFKKDHDVLIKVNKRPISINKYIPLESKTTIQQIIFTQCFDADGYFDWIKYEMFFKCLVLAYYTDLNLPTTKVEGSEQPVLDVYTIYDIAMSGNLYKRILWHCYRDVKKLEEMIIDSIDEKRRNFEYKHSVGSLLGEFLAKMMNVNPEDFGQVIDQLSSVDTLKTLNLIQKVVERNVGV
jgi:hypothetical protein